MSKPILCLDFDGVIHSYSSGWKGVANIPDEPVPGALEFIVGALDRFTVAIFSSRSHQWGGKRAMKRYIRDQLIALATTYETTPEWWLGRINETAFADPWPEEVEYAANGVVKEIKWPWFKPPALVTIDDRAIQFTGEFPALGELVAFKPWNRRGV